MNIKPIETIYKGYRFRSRLEARWAVFFDALGIEWKYENEGYDLGELGYYLPDFEINFDSRLKHKYPQYDKEYWFVEVKGDKNDEKGIAKARYLDTYCQEPFNGCRIFGELEFIKEPKLIEIYKVEQDNVSYDVPIFDEKYNWQIISADMLNVTREEYNKAIAKARQARFEHGETPLCKF